jgi:hypothetical protein
VFEDPVGAVAGAGEASGDAVAGGFDAVPEVEVDFGDDTGYVDALVVWGWELVRGFGRSWTGVGLTAYTAAVVCGCYKVGKFLFGDYAFADGTLPYVLSASVDV